MAKLVFLTGTGASIAINKPRMSIGRRGDNDIQVIGESVSGLHARLEFRNGVFSIEDQISTNGTFVNGKRVTRCPLQDGDVVSIGGQELRFIAETEHEWPASTGGHDDMPAVDVQGDHTQFVPTSLLQAQYKGVLQERKTKRGFWQRLFGRSKDR